MTPSTTSDDTVNDTNTNTATKEREQKKLSQSVRSSVSDDYDDDDEEYNNHKQARVSFRNIEVHEHSYILGDNPSVSSGAPLSISWKKQGSAEFDLDEYESEKSRRKDKSHLRLSNSDRAALLLQSGYTMEDIVLRSLEVNEDKDNRAESRRNQKWDGINHAIEKTTSKLKKVVRRSSMLATTPISKLNSGAAALVKKMPRRNSVTGTPPLMPKQTPDSDPVAARSA